MREYILSNDPYQMNWIEGKEEWGTVKCPESLSVQVKRERQGDVVREEYVFTNHTDRDVLTSLEETGIYATFNDDYLDSDTCLKRRCHTHIWCGGEVSWIMALRMGGEVPHLGLVLTKGSLEGYSVERDLSRGSNDRGDFILHPESMALMPGESYTLEWVLFPFGGKEDFFRQAVTYCSRFLQVEADRYVLFQGEEINVTITPNFPFTVESVSLWENGRRVEPGSSAGGGMGREWGVCEPSMVDKPVFSVDGNRIRIRKKADSIGEVRYDICVGGVKTKCRLLVQPELDELARIRCHFIATRQQYLNPGSRLDGAYLIYDNEEKHLKYTPKNDDNAGRERIGMGILMARYLQGACGRELEGQGGERNPRNCEMDASLRKYIEFVMRELVDKETGEVFNDYMRDNSYRRLYNAPWYALFFVEVYRLYQEKEYLATACSILRYFYHNGGKKFYAIELPVLQMADCLREAGMEKELAEITGYFKEHGDCLLAQGKDYPKLEVNYEQSIVAPAADILAQVFLLTGEEKYKEAFEDQLSVLELFNGVQPDYRLNEVAIRHWDGYWFGKRCLYGDTFPHYWSSLTGNVYGYYGQINYGEGYQEKAEKSIRASLSLFRPDGTASCAHVYPVSVNGREGSFDDPYANDQDWGLYFALRYRMLFAAAQEI